MMSKKKILWNEDKLYIQIIQIIISFSDSIKSQSALIVRQIMNFVKSYQISANSANSA